MNVFEAVKQSVTTRQAAEHYGIHVGRNGMACCPFHHDKTPSMKLDRRYHCFGCGADGDVIDFVSRLEQATPKEAALMLARDFSIPYADKWPPRRRKPRQETPEQSFKRMERHCFRVLCDYRSLLRRWKEDYAPKTPDWIGAPVGTQRSGSNGERTSSEMSELSPQGGSEGYGTCEDDWNPLFVEALQKQDYVDYLLDTLLFSDMEERAALIASHGKEVRTIERRMADLAARDTAGRRTDYARSSPAPER